MKKKLIHLDSIDEVFQRIRNNVNNIVANFLPDAWEKFNSCFYLLKLNDIEKWSNAVHICRRILKDLADLVFPATEETHIFQGSNKPSKLGSEQYINRILAFLENSQSSSTFVEMISADVNLYSDAIIALYQGINKGSHDIITSQEEADRYVLNTYLIVGDILSLWYCENKPKNLIEGLTNTIFYTSEKETLINLYYTSRISPCKMIIRPEYPLGTGTNFIILFRKNYKMLTKAFNLGNLQSFDFSSFAFEGASPQLYMQIGTHLFGKNNPPFLLIAIGDGSIHLNVTIIEYIPAKSEDQINENNWRIVGQYQGQRRAIVSNNEIYFPYGSKGLGDTYQWINEKFVHINEKG